MKRLWVILPVLLIVGCSKDLDTLQDRDGIYFGINSEKPFSGSVNKKYQSGQIELKGIITNGKKDGFWTEWYENGQKESEGTYKDGKEDGFWTEWHFDGQKESEGTYKDGKEDGLWTDWYKDGQKAMERTYKDGKRISTKCWSWNGIECAECGSNYFEGWKCWDN